ncbi:MAG: hypothetical protein M3198_17290 [Actinomycetota bacterium]|nr:hypothetical protein [Actinomycetota bacterium]
MRKLTEPQAHRGRVAVIEGNFPEGMRARCAWCQTIEPVEQGQMLASVHRGAGPTRLYRCSKCVDGEREGAA